MGHCSDPVAYAESKVSHIEAEVRQAESDLAAAERRVDDDPSPANERRLEQARTVLAQRRDHLARWRRKAASAEEPEHDRSDSNVGDAGAGTRPPGRASSASSPRKRTARSSRSTAKRKVGRKRT